MPFAFLEEKKGDVSLQGFWKLCGHKMKDILLLDHQIVSNIGYETHLEPQYYRKRYSSLEQLKNSSICRIQVLQRLVFLDLSWICLLSFILSWSSIPVVLKAR